MAQHLTTVPGTSEGLRQRPPLPPGLLPQRHFSIWGGISALVLLYVLCPVGTPSPKSFTFYT